MRIKIQWLLLVFQLYFIFIFVQRGRRLNTSIIKNLCSTFYMSEEPLMAIAGTYIYCWSSHMGRISASHQSKSNFQTIRFKFALNIARAIVEWGELPLRVAMPLKEHFFERIIKIIHMLHLFLFIFYWGFYFALIEN